MFRWRMIHTVQGRMACCTIVAPTAQDALVMWRVKESGRRLLSRLHIGITEVRTLLMVLPC